MIFFCHFTNITILNIRAHFCCRKNQAFRNSAFASSSSSHSSCGGALRACSNPLRKKISSPVWNGYKAIIINQNNPLGLFLPLIEFGYLFYLIFHVLPILQKSYYRTMVWQDFSFLLPADTFPDHTTKVQYTS